MNPAVGLAGSGGSFEAVGWIGRIWNFILRNLRRLVVLLVGSAVIVLGILLLVLPGPGMLTIVAGVAILATEFAWAAWLLRHLKRHALKATRLAMRRVKALERIKLLRRWVLILERELEELEHEVEVEDGDQGEDGAHSEPRAMADRETG